MKWDYIQIGKTTYILPNGDLINESKLRKPSSIYIPDFLENDLNRDVSAFSFVNGQIVDRYNDYMAMPEGAFIPFKNFQLMPTTKMQVYGGNWENNFIKGDIYTLRLGMDGLNIAFQSVVTDADTNIYIHSGVTDEKYRIILSHFYPVEKKKHPFNSISGYTSRNHWDRSYLYELKGMNDAEYPVFYRGYAHPERIHVFLYGTLAILFNVDMSLKAVVTLSGISRDAINVEQVLLSRDAWFAKVRLAT